VALEQLNGRDRRTAHVACDLLRLGIGLKPAAKALGVGHHALRDLIGPDDLDAARQERAMFVDTAIAMARERQTKLLEQEIVRQRHTLLALRERARPQA
jgi:hypothetical protein